MGITDDPNDPALTHGADAPGSHPGQAEKYLVLPLDMRSSGFVRPVRTSYMHLVCGGVTSMAQAIAETYARNPSFYGATFCTRCQEHRPVGENGEFVWQGTDEKVGT